MSRPDALAIAQRVTFSVEAGRDLDARIELEVFGPWDESRCRVCGWKIVPEGEAGCWPHNCSMRFPDGMYPPRADEPKPYSTDIAAAWEVVEKLRADDINFSLGNGYMGNSYRAWFQERATRTGGRGRNWDADADTAPLAICRAALAAVRGPSGKDTP